MMNVSTIKVPSIELTLFDVNSTKNQNSFINKFPYFSSILFIFSMIASTTFLDMNELNAEQIIRNEFRSLQKVCI